MSTTESVNSGTQEGKIFTKETVDSLSHGILNAYVPPLAAAKSQLKELTDKQLVLIEQLHNENLKLSWTQNSVEFLEMYDSMKLYQNKLMNIKKDMKSLHDRSVKLKKRAVRLQQSVEKETYIKNQQKGMELKREQDLINQLGENG